ncbi:MAG TPA: hypothetical protein VFX61_03595 [Micromonosporaceae bacterium]|nr:hypothetical protein [Micromonosporaceae bacterium]
MKPHRTDMVSLTFSLIFLAIGAWWLLAQIFHLPLPTIGWIVAAGLILFGLLGALGALRSSPPPAPPPAEPTIGTDGTRPEEA